MSNEQYSPWASGDGFGTPAPQQRPSPPEDNPPTLDQPASNYSNPTVGYANPTSTYSNPAVGDSAEPTGWSQPQQFGSALQSAQPQYPSPAQAYSFGQRLPYGLSAEQPEHPNATAALVVGIVGIMALFVMFPLISPVAWYLGAKGRREMREQPGRWRTSGSLTAGFVLGIVGTLIAIAFVALILVALALVVA